MKRRSGATGAASKARGRKTQTPKRRVARKAMRPQRSSVASREPDVAQVIRERDEALEQQTASAEVLQIISGSTFDLQTVLDTLVKSAARLCEADAAAIWRPDGGKLKMAANFGASSEWKEFAKQNPITPDRGTISGRVILEGKVVHVRDVLADPEITGVGYFVRGNYRTSLGVPLSRKGETIGVFVIVRSEVREFTEKQIKLVTTFAAQAVIAIENARLLNELRQRTDDLSQRTADLTEALEQQTATSEVLQVISSSPGELKPVFQTILENATRICGANFGMFHLREGEALTNAAVYNIPEPYMEFRRRTPLTISPNHPLARLAATKEVVHIADLKADDGYREGDPSYHAMVDLAGARTLLLVPTLKEREIIGVITIFRQEARLFTDKQVDLVKNFAAQAVIAIENAWLLNELRQRTTDLTEALEQQTATSEVLEVISSSPGALEPVFAKMLENAARICDAQFGNIFQWDGVALRLVGTHNTPPAFAELLRRSPLRPTHSNSSLGRMLASKAADQNADVAAGQLYAERDPMAVAAVEVGGVRTVLNVPMLKDNELLGAFSIYRQEVRPFTDKQVDLVKNFAAQAVIAIENARLLNELRQSLEQQTASAEVLQVISRSPGDLEPVFAAMLENAVRICHANFGNIYRWDGESLQLVATFNTPPAFAEARRRSPFRPAASDPVGRMIAAKTIIHVSDTTGYPGHDPQQVAAIEIGGIKTSLSVPMLREGDLIGAFVLSRQEVKPFTDRQIELATSFAAQAVIAIENARLLNELRQRTIDLTEALEQQTATSEVLRVISSTAGELEPVFATILASATRICEAEFGNLLFREEEAFRIVAWHGEPTYVNAWRHEALIVRTDVTDIPLSRVAATKKRVHIADLRQEAAYKAGFAPLVALVDKGGARTILIVPMLQEHALIGAIAIYRQDVRPFTDKQIALMENFAAQAVIAIENARLLKELRERTDEVEKLNQQLERRVADQVGEIERMGRLRRFLPQQVADLIVASGTEKQLESHRREITALFCDLRGFTGFSESSDPEDVMALLRDYHAAIGEIIIKYSGTLERYAGDGVMVVFNDPVPVEKPALQAVLMALEMREVIGALTEKWRRLGHEIGFGIGIAHGFATLGTIGFEGRFDYAAIGTVANVASRLCDEAKPGQILVSPRVFMAVEDAVTVEPVGEFTLKGIRRPLAAYNVLAANAAN